jgi:uncharacterized protein YecT (DUF1311 family)
MTFKKGYDPKRNMKGRPKLGMTTAERIRDAMNEPAKGQKGYTKFDEMVDMAMARARKGSYGFWDALMNRAYGKVPDKVEMQTEEKPNLSKLTDEEIDTLMALLAKAKPK